MKFRKLDAGDWFVVPDVSHKYSGYAFITDQTFVFQKLGRVLREQGSGEETTAIRLNDGFPLDIEEDAEVIRILL